MTAFNERTDYSDSFISTPRLSPAEEITLARIIQKGLQAEQALTLSTTTDILNRQELEKQVKAGEFAYQQYWKANIRLVISAAWKHVNRGLEHSDLVSEGMFGLHTAIRKFDPERGFRFSTYAMPWINQAMGRAISQQASLIRLPERKAELLAKIGKAKATLTQLTGQEPHVTDLAEATDIPVEEIQKLMGYQVRSVSLDAPIGDESDAGSFNDLVEDVSSPDPADVVAKGFLATTLRSLLATLPADEAAVVALRFGVSPDTLEEQPTATLEATGAALGLTVKQVRRLEANALTRLRQVKDLADFLS